MNTVLSAFIEMITIFVEIIANVLECQGTISCSVWNIPHIHRSINKVSSSTSTARFSTNSNQAGTRRSPMHIKNGTVLSIFLTSRSTACSWGYLIHLMCSFHACNQKSLLIRLGLTPRSSRLASVSSLFEDTPTEILV